MMKTKMMWLLLAAMTVLSACSKDEDGGDPNDPNVMRTIKLAVDVSYPYSLSFELEHREGSCQDECGEFIAESIIFPTDLSINWGDGQVTNSDSHRYSNFGTYNISISAKNLRWFDNSDNNRGILAVDFGDCNSLVGIKLKGDLVTLDVAGMKVLEYLDCWYNKLTSLDIKGCSSLTYLNCSENNLSTEVLNEIFKNLPQGKKWPGKYRDELQSTIDFAYNPGSGDCDVSILEKKGWKYRK